MDAERKSLRQRLSDTETEQLVVDRHISDLEHQIQREQSEFDRRLSAAKETLTTTDIQSREMKTSFAQTERALLSSQKHQIQTLTEMTRETLHKKADEKRKELTEQISSLQSEIETLSKERDQVLEDNIKILKDVGEEDTNSNNNTTPSHNTVARFMHKLLTMREGWRERDVQSISRFIREEVNSALTDLDQQRHTKFVNDKLQRTKQLQKHYADRNSEFNGFRIKRATVNEEHRQQTVSSVRDRARATAKKVATQMKEHVDSIEKLMEGEASNAHKEMRKTMETLTEQRRNYIASEENENQHKIVAAAAQNSQEREQLNQRLKNELEALRRAKVLLSSSSSSSTSPNNNNNTFSSTTSSQHILSEWFKTNKVRLQQEASRIQSTAESSLGQIRGQVAHLRQQQQSNNENSSLPLRPMSFFERYDELRSQLDVAKSHCKDSWGGLTERLSEFTNRVLENVESLSGGVLRNEVVAQSQEAERVRQEWERDLRRRMAEESLLFLGGGGGTDNNNNNNNNSTVNTHQIISQITQGLARRLQKSHDMMKHLRTTRDDSLSSVLSETEQVTTSFEEVLMTTTRLLDTCPELARVSTKAQILQEVVERDADQIDEEKEYIKQVKKHKNRVKQMIDDAGPLLVSSSKDHNTNSKQKTTEKHSKKYHREEGDEEETDESRVNTTTSARHRYKPIISGIYEMSRKELSKDTSSKKYHHHDPLHHASSSSEKSFPSKRAMQDPFVAAQQRQRHQNKKTSSTRNTTNADDEDESFEPLVEFSDDGASSQVSASSQQPHQHQYRYRNQHHHQQQIIHTPIYQDTTQPRMNNHTHHPRDGSTASTTATSLTTGTSSSSAKVNTATGEAATASSSNHQNNNNNNVTGDRSHLRQHHREASPQPDIVGHQQQQLQQQQFSAASPSSFIQQAQQLQQRFGGVGVGAVNNNNQHQQQQSGYQSAGGGSATTFRSLTTPTPDPATTTTTEEEESN